MYLKPLKMAALCALLSGASTAWATTPLLVAGGGGGSGYVGADVAGGAGQTGTSGAAGSGTSGGSGGVAGSGGAGGTGDGGQYNGGGGGGWSGNGTAGLGTYPSPEVESAAGQGGYGAPSFTGGLGGNVGGQTSNGGYGGGGGGGWQGGGGGGGYSGGGGGDGVNAGAGGGGSYVGSSLTLVSAVAGANGVDDSNLGTTIGKNGYLTINGATFTYSGSIQDYIVPLSGLYTIVAAGAQGGGGDSGAIGGYGALITASGLFSAGTDLKIIVGQAGNYGNFDGRWGGGGGGGTFLFTDGGTAPAAAPEPASWAMMISGFGLLGGALRHRRGTAMRLA